MIAGVSSYSFMQYIRAGKMTQLDAVRKAAELGFAAIEFTELTPHDGSSKEAYAKAIVREAGRYNMQISAYAVSACLIQPTAEQTRAELARVKREIDVAAMLGVPVMRHDAYFAQRKYKSFDQSLPELAAHIRELAGYAEACGIQTAVENHGQICQDSDRMERLFNAVNHPNFGLLADIGNFMCADESPAAAVSRIAPYALHVHAKDFRKYGYGVSVPEPFYTTRACNKLQGTALGEGEVPVQQCLQILKNAGYNGCVSIEFEGREDCLAALSKSLKNLNASIKNLS